MERALEGNTVIIIITLISLSYNEVWVLNLVYQKHLPELVLKG